MLVIEPHAAAAAAAVRFSAANFDRFQSSNLLMSRNKCCKLRDNAVGRRCGGRVVVKAAAKEQSSSSSGPVKQNAKPQRYHPSEEIADSELLENGEATLTPAEATRTIIEVNSKATLMFSGMVNEEVHENIFWPDLPYVTDEHGNIYFQVKTEEDILQTLTSEETIVQVIVGLDTAEMLSELDALGHSENDFGIDELDGEDTDYNDEEEDEDDDDDDAHEDGDEDSEDWVAILDGEEDQDEESDGSLGDWAKLETMRSSHPMYFAKKLTEIVSDDPLDFMEQPSSGLAIQGLLRPAFLEEHSVIQKNASDPESGNANANNIADERQEEVFVKINGHQQEIEQSPQDPTWEEELEKEENMGSGFSFYKLEMIKIQLVSAHGLQSGVEIDDFKRARPDAIAHSAAKIIQRLKSGGEKTTQALKSLCWRCKGIQVEECALIGVDSLGFDLRVCSGTQLQTLRFAFKKRASSEYSAERHLNDMLFPRNHKVQPRKETQQTES